MDNIEQIQMHPLLEEAIERERAKHMKELAEVESERAELEEKLDEAQSDFDNQYRTIQKLFDKSKKEKRELTLNEILDGLYSNKAGRDWGLLNDVCDLLRDIKVPTKIEYETEIREVEIIPKTLQNNIKKVVEILNVYLD